MIALETWNPKYKIFDMNDKLYHSQQREAQILEHIFSCVEPKNKWLVDLGACDGVNGSNSYDLIKNGWSGLLIEADAHFMGIAKDNYSNENEEVQKKVFFCHMKVDRGFFSEEITLNKIIKNYPIPKDFDFLSIDIDSYDYEVWRNLDYHPNVVCIECNSVEEDINVINYDPSYSVQVPPYGGATVGLLRRLAEEKDYDYLCVEQCNAFFIDKEFGKPLQK